MATINSNIGCIETDGSEYENKKDERLIVI